MENFTHEQKLINEISYRIAKLESSNEDATVYIYEIINLLSDSELLTSKTRKLIERVRYGLKTLYEEEGFDTNYMYLCDAVDELSKEYEKILQGASTEGFEGEEESEITVSRKETIREEDVEEIRERVLLIWDMLEDLNEGNSKHVLGVIAGFCDRLASFENIPKDFLNIGSEISTLANEIVSEKVSFKTCEEGIKKVSNKLAEILEIYFPGKIEITPSQETKKKDQGKVVVKKNSYKLDASNPELIEFVTETTEYLDGAEVAMIELENDSSNRDYLNEVFRFIHNIKGIAGFLNLKDVQDISHEAETLLDSARRGEFEFCGKVSSITFDTLDLLREMVRRVDAAVNHDEEYFTPDNYEKVMANLKGFSAEDTQSPVFKTDEMKSDFEWIENENNTNEVFSMNIDVEKENNYSEKSNGDSKVKGKNGKAVEGFVKVGTFRLDNLIDAVGELVIANAMIMGAVENREDISSDLSQNVSQLDLITRDLQELAMGMRMVSLKPTFQKMSRIARDISVKSDTLMEFTYSGEDTEIDRNVVEAITSPLVHMVRNAVDHGIDKPEQRKALGKSSHGKIHLSAAHEGGNVVIRIEDDGKGLDKTAIINKAVSKGLIAADAELSDREINNLIFHPGFSTASKVTDVSGRGVGMDVVKKSIETLRGRIEIQSVPNGGTSFTIRLPLTLAIIDGMMIKAGEEYYIVPTIAIQESIRPTADELSTAVNKGEMVSIRGRLAPLYRLNRLMNIKNAKEDPQDALLLIMGDGTDRFALMVDDLLGQQQVVIKSLGKIVGRPDGVAGGAIMGDGKVALILDMQGLQRLADDYQAVSA